LLSNFISLWNEGYIDINPVTIENLIKVFYNYLVKNAATIALEKDRVMYHTRLWACNNCVITEKAIVAKIEKQIPNFSGPAMMYLDLMYTCNYCDNMISFTAKEQQYWYEELNLQIETKAKRCVDCRQKQKAQKRLMELAAQGPSYTIQDLTDFIDCYRILGSEKKQKEFEGRLKNKKKEDK